MLDHVHILPFTYTGLSHQQGLWSTLSIFINSFNSIYQALQIVRIRPSPGSRALPVWRERLAGKHTGQFVLEVSAGGSGDPEDAVAGAT